MMNIGGIVYVILALSTAVVGFHIHHSVFWAITDFIFVPYVWLKWLILQQVNLTIIKASFAWFLK